LGHIAYKVYNLIVVPHAFFPKRTPQLQGRNEVRWRPVLQASLAPPCLNLKSFGSKCTSSKKVLVTLLGLFSARGIVPPFPSLLPCPACNCFGIITNNSVGTTSVAAQQLLTYCPDRLTRFRVQYRQSRQIQTEHSLLLIKWPTFEVSRLE